MRTKIEAGWIVGHEKGHHTLLRDGVVVFEGSRIIHVGPSFEGEVDRTIDARGKLVTPGFIDTHVHSGHRASHRLISDTGRPIYYGQPFLEISVPKEGATVSGDARYLKHGDPGAEAAFARNATFTVAELLRNGVTTFIEFGSQLKVQDALLAEVSRLGTRAYLAPGYDCGRWVGDEQGRLKRVRDEKLGLDGLEVALDWIARNDGAAGGRVRGILVPREVETASLELLRRTREAADELGLPMATHAAYSVIEFYETVREYMMTPIEVLDSLGMLRPTLNIGHGNFISDNPNLNFARKDDLRLMGEAGVSISHCPINIVRRSRTLDSWESYRAAGVNISIGSDTYPRDMIMNMRTASYLGKVMSHTYLAATAGQALEAATLGGARSVGRDDLGRLAPGALADIVIIDQSGRNSLRYGPVRDPVKSLVECGVGDDVDTVIVDGEIRMENGIIPGVDFGELNAWAQQAGEAVWDSLAQWDPLGRSAEEACPWCYPAAGFACEAV
ncbi:chlorohydrolase family protein [Ancylobacter mangrovi]|uniref:chlorohydrolase family protein n=1 Tax=Ancylobacter mangrovi TaxID=2972472 RepID=UPI0021631E3E|nr:chlorohydrolase family protein [Ancylobacter mangrovi]MCS0503194.1 chlorohydrolase family protein [Ancylobacter mangrovi]